MSPSPLRQKLARRPLLLALLLLASLASLGVLLHLQARSGARTVAYDSMASTATLSARTLTIWFDERRADADAVATSPLFSRALRQAGGSGEGARVALAELQQHLDLIRSRYDYRAIVLLDFTTRQPLLRAGGVNYSPALFGQMLDSTDGTSGRWVEMVGDTAGTLHAGLVRAVGPGPLLSRYGLFFELDLAKLSASLNQQETAPRGLSVLLHASHPNGAGRYFLLGKQGLRALNGSGTGPAEPVEKRLGLVGSGQLEGRDHQGVQVIAHAARVPATPWTVIATQDLGRALAPADQQTRITSLALGGLFLLGLLLIQVWRRDEKLRALALETELMRHREVMFRGSDDAIVTIDESDCVIEANEAALRMYGYPRAKFIGMPMQLLRPPEGRQAQKEFMENVHPGETHTLHAVHQRANGSTFIAEISLGMSEVDGKRLLHAALRDVTARQAIETRLRIAASFFERSNAAVLIADAEGRVQMINTAFSRTTGYSAEELVGRPWAGLQECVAQAGAGAAGGDSLQARKFWEGELPQLRKSGETYPSRVILTAYTDAGGQIDQYVMVHTDLTRIRQAESQLQYASSRDLLTGLPNRAQMEQRVSELSERAGRDGEPFVFVMVNLDRWRSINDSVGFSTADQLLRLVAERLLAHFPGEQNVFRFGGDEFAALLTGEAAGDYGTFMDRLLIALVQPMQLGWQTFQLTASAGVSLCPGLAGTLDDLVQQASAALQVAKQQGRNTWRLYNATMGRSSYEDLALMQDLRQAAGRGELSLHLQPQYTTADMRLVGMEALLRWTHPVRGNIPPFTFIPMAEASGLIIEISRWVLHEACRLWSDWRARGLQPPPIAVNLSALQFHQANFISETAAVLQQYGLPQGALEMEITESLLMSDVDSAIERMHELVKMGVRLSIDDFGTGYSSLSYLRRFPVHKLKIDRSFVTELSQDEGAIAVAVINMAKSLHLTVIAEGVETGAQLAFLREHGCDEVQGYLCGRPMPASELQKLLPKP